MSKYLNKYTIIIITSLVALVAIVIFLISFIIQQNSFQITNFSKYYSHIPSTTRNNVYTSIEDIIALNNPSINIDKVRATIRQNTATEKYNEDENTYYSTFVIDIEDLQQSYYTQFEWSKDSNNEYMSGNSTMTTCVPEKYKIYNFDCLDYSDDE